MSKENTKVDAALDKALELRKAKKFTEAIELLEPIVSADERCLPAWRSLAACYYLMDHYAGAKRCFSKVIEMDGDCALATEGLMLSLFHLGEENEARREIKRFLSIADKDNLRHQPVIEGYLGILDGLAKGMAPIDYLSKLKPNFWKEFRDPIIFVRDIDEEYSVAFVVEPTRPGFVHACTVDDICKILAWVDPSLQDELDMIVLRQFDEEEEAYRATWGRFGTNVDAGPYRGNAIFLTSQRPGGEHWETPIDPGLEQQLKRLSLHGHSVTFDGQRYQVQSSLSALRSFQLYDILFHEFGHLRLYIDRCLNRINKNMSDAEIDAIFDEYRSSSYETTEGLCDEFSDSMKADFESRGLIPFERIFDIESIKRDGLDPEWFMEPKE